MNRKQLILLLVVLAIIGSAGLVLFNRSKESWTVLEAKMGDKVLPNFQYNDVAAIHIKGGSDLNVVRKDGLWRVQQRSDYPADFHLISEMLISIRDLKVVQSETVGPSQLGRVELTEPGSGPDGGTLVEFNDSQGKLLDAMLLGKKHIREQTEGRNSPFSGVGSPDGRYILLRSDPKNVLLISNALAIFEPRPELWLSKDFFKVEKMKSISLTLPNATTPWKVAHETESSPWVLLDAKPGEVLDTNKVSVTAGMLNYASFIDVASGVGPAQTGLDKPKVVNIETFDHFAYTLKIGAKGPEDTYYTTVTVTANLPTERNAGRDEKPADKEKLDNEFREKAKKLQDKLTQEQALAPWVYLVNSWFVDPLIRDRAQILEASGASSPAPNSAGQIGDIPGGQANTLIK